MIKKYDTENIINRNDDVSINVDSHNSSKNNNIFINLHNIDIEMNTPVSKEVNTNDAKDYIRKIVEETQNNANKRFFKFPDGATPVLESITRLFGEKDSDKISEIFNNECDKLAYRLLRAEQMTAEKHIGIPRPKKGSLIITMEKLNSDIRITMAKIETEEFLDEINLRLLSGLPTNKKTLKSAIFNIISTEDEFECEIIISDSNSSISKYWYEGFLEVIEIIGDEKNTKLAFAAIDQLISRTVKRYSPSDYTELRNNLVRYFKTQSNFHLDSMIEHVFGDYQINSDEVTIEEVKEKVRKLSEKNSFDTQFKIIPEEIKAKFKKTYKITEQIEIRTIGHITDLKHMIRSKINDSGDKVLEIKIENDNIYEEFKFTD